KMFNSTCCCALTGRRLQLIRAVMGHLFTLWMGTLLQLCHATIYTNDWAIKVRGDPESVKRIAEKYGFTNMGQVSVLKYRAYSLTKPSNNSPSCTEASGCQTGMNIAAAWRRGYTGKGVVVSVLDDGIEKEHPDLKPNYVSALGREALFRKGTLIISNLADHGTQCAGTVAASANNSLSDVTDIVEAVSLNFRPQYIDIYLASWGPDDDGATLEGPGPLARLALQTAVETGRHGRGSIFVWASGNGGKAGDHCSCDGYSSSIYTISVSSVGRRGVRPEHLEQCSSTLAAAYGGEETKRMITLRPQQGCSRTLSGTSLSSSLAAGVIALTLEANPLLTWRDVQHIIVRTSKAHHLIAPDWHFNGAGYKVSHLYGFGLLDAESMAKEAERWKQVPAQHECVEEEAIQIIHPGSVLTSAYETTGCSSAASRHVVYVEHVVIRVTITHSRRGDLSITLTSPAGTVSQLLAHRPLDNSTEGFQNWEFMTAHSWGEQAAGEWTLKITDTPSRKRDSSAELGILKMWSLVIYGTAEQPYHMRRRRVRSAEPSVDSDLTEGYDGESRCSSGFSDGNLRQVTNWDPFLDRVYLSPFFTHNIK
uniref:Proprotein convertase subtilisin/kexin type 5a n=1 Tax=Poecilia latipinna TaxID=48699 RepID=A0A3B3TR46_9TELE